MSGQNKYTIATRMAMLENAVTELRKENAELRVHLVTELKNAVNDSVGATGATGRDGASVVGPVGPAGKDSNVPGPKGETGKRGDNGPRGERGEKGEQGIQGPAGRDGKDGQSIVGPVGPQGERGDCLIPNDSEIAAALKKERLYLAKRHAAFIAPIVDRLEFERTHNLKVWNAHTAAHFWRLLQEIQERIEKLS